MDFNVIDYLVYHADVAVPAIILMVIVSTIYLIFYGIRPIKTRFFILFLLSIVSLIIFVMDNPLYYYLGSPYSGLLFVFYNLSHELGFTNQFITNEYIPFHGRDPATDRCQ
jgi:multisubunit Na+/H+ antiporter MnhB subunit